MERGHVPPEVEKNEASPKKKPPSAGEENEKSKVEKIPPAHSASSVLPASVLNSKSDKETWPNP